MIEVFFCSCPTSMGRYNLANQMLNFWKRLRFQGLIKLVAYTAPRESRYRFQVNRRKMAEAEAKGDIYILTDDDMEPLLIPTIDDPLANDAKEWLLLSMEKMEAHPEFAILSALPEGINKWLPPDYQPVDDANVMEHVSVGGLRFVRKGCMKDWPEQDGPGYDMAQAEYLRANGWRVGYFKHLKAIHHGEGNSTVWPNLQMANA